MGKENKEAKNTAEGIFGRITSGRGNAIQRPERTNSFWESVDRCLRDMVNKSNKNGDCIINVGNGYYRPRPGVEIEKMELYMYLREETQKAYDSINKNQMISITYGLWEKEAGVGS